MRTHIKFYFSLLSPWSYLGYAELLRIAQKHDAHIEYKPLKLMNIFDELGGAPLSKRHPSRQAYRFHELRRWSARRGIALNVKPQFFPFDSQLANSVVLSLIDQNLQPDDFILRAFEATWQQERNLADELVIAEILNNLNLPDQDIIANAKTPGIQAQYELHTQDGIHDGAFGVPFIIVNDEPFWGQDRLDFVEEALVKINAQLPGKA